MYMQVLPCYVTAVTTAAAGATVACRCSPQLYKLLHSTVFRALLLRPVEKVMCPMVTVSQLIQQCNIQ
jgi:hypothetical protein